MSESQYEENIEKIIQDFDPKLQLNKIKDINLDKLLNWIETIQKEIDIYENKWREKVFNLADSFSCEALQDREFKTSRGSSYENSQAYIRCFDEEKYHLNNREGLASFSTPHDEKRGLQYYTYPFNQYIAFAIAKRLGLHSVQETSLALIKSPLFVTRSEEVKEKICSLEKKVPNAIDPLTFIVSFFKEREGQDVKKILEDLYGILDYSSFEEVFLFSWLIGEMDGTSLKYLLVQDGDKMKFLKTNSSMCFSSNYFETDSFLIALSFVNREVSQESKENLLHFDPSEIIELMKYFEKDEGAISCFQDRLRRMKILAQVPNVAIKNFVPIGFRKNHWKVESFLLKLYYEGIAFT